MDNNHLIMVHDVELLAVSTADLRGKPRVILTLRLDPAGDFEITNLALTAQQGHRLFEDLEEAIRNSKLLGRLDPGDGGKRAAFEVIMFGQPPAKSEDRIRRDAD